MASGSVVFLLVALQLSFISSKRTPDNVLEPETPAMSPQAEAKHEERIEQEDQETLLELEVIQSESTAHDGSVGASDPMESLCREPKAAIEASKELVDLQKAKEMSRKSAAATTKRSELQKVDDKHTPIIAARERAETERKTQASQNTTKQAKVESLQSQVLASEQKIKALQRQVNQEKAAAQKEQLKKQLAAEKKKKDDLTKRNGPLKSAQDALNKWDSENAKQASQAIKEVAALRKAYKQEKAKREAELDKEEKGKVAQANKDLKDLKNAYNNKWKAAQKASRQCVTGVPSKLD